MGKESTEAEIRSEQRAMEAEHGKEMAALKAEEAQRTAALKAEHAKTPGKTGLLAKLTGHEDPVKKAEKQQLAAEIARAEEATKAEHAFENADLKAQKSKEHATVGAADSLMGHGDHNGLKRSGAGLHDEHGRDNKLYNHATGAHGVAALQDDGLGDHHHGRSATGHQSYGHNGSQTDFGGPQAGFGHSIMGSGPDNGLGDSHRHGDHAGRTDTGHHNNDHHNNAHHGHDGSQNAGGFGGHNNMDGQIFTQVVGQAPVMAQMPVAAVPFAASSMPASSCSGGIAPVTVIAPGQGGRY
jgi:hypothetical protein